MKVTIRDFRASGICPDSRKWFAKHGLDWKDFVRNGIDEEKLLATGDGRAERVVSEAHGRR